MNWSEISTESVVPYLHFYATSANNNRLLANYCLWPMTHYFIMKKSCNLMYYNKDDIRLYCPLQARVEKKAEITRKAQTKGLSLQSFPSGPNAFFTKWHLIFTRTKHLILSERPSLDVDASGARYPAGAVVEPEGKDVGEVWNQAFSSCGLLGSEASKFRGSYHVCKPLKFQAQALSAKNTACYDMFSSRAWCYMSKQILSSSIFPSPKGPGLCVTEYYGQGPLPVAQMNFYYSCQSNHCLRP